MEKECVIKDRKSFFEKIMELLDDAEGKKDNRNSKYGPFSFLEEKFYVRGAVVSSLGKIPSIAGLKMFLAINVLEMHYRNNDSRISYKELKESVEGISKKSMSLIIRV